MATASRAINVKVGGAHGDVGDTLRRLYFRRRLLQGGARGATVLACALAALFVTAFVDYRWQLTRPARLALFSVILISVSLLLTRMIWLLLRRRTFVDAAREMERAAGSGRNALVTWAEDAAGRRGTLPYMLARLERQARSDLAGMGERVAAPRAATLRAAG